MLIERINADYMASRKFKAENISYADKVGEYAELKADASAGIAATDGIVTERVILPFEELLVRRITERNAVKKALLSTLITDISMVGKNASPSRDTTEAEAKDVVQLYVNRLRKAIDTIEQAKALATKEKAELSILLNYLPKQMTTEEVKAVLATALAGGAVQKNIGALMGFMKSNHEGQYDAKAVSGIAKELCI